jgi:hypothetical protein
VQVKINGKPVDYTMENGYAVLNRTWKKNDVVEISLPMEVRRVVANEKVKDDAGRIALQRGPLLYCAEWPDNNNRVSNIIIPASAVFVPEYKADLLNGVTILKSEAVTLQTADEQVTTVKKPFIAIPYYAWANRGKGEMMVWFPERIKDVEILSD